MAAILMPATTTGVAALGPDERGRERIRGDDDPIIVPASVAMPEMDEFTTLEPETTGSIDRGRTRSQRTCNRFAFHLHDPTRMGTMTRQRPRNTAT